MGIISGFIQGVIAYDQSGTPAILPFDDKIEGAAFRYTSESLKTMTFNAQGIKGNSAACPFMEECSWELSSKDLAWSFMQAAFGALDQATTLVYPITESVVLTTDDTTDSTYDTGTTIAPGTTVSCADLDGTTYNATFAAGVITLTGEGILTGTRVTFTYFVDGSAIVPDVREINVGNPVTRLTNVGLYGTFFGCPDSLTIVSNNVIIEADINLAVNDSPAEVALSATCLRDNTGSYARIIRNASKP